MRTLFVAAVALTILTACGEGPAPGTDGGSEVDGSRPTGPCASDTDCDDGLYCNGAERCDAEDPDADERGCVVWSPRKQQSWLWPWLPPVADPRTGPSALPVRPS